MCAQPLFAELCADAEKRGYANAASTETPGVAESDHAFNLRSQTNRPQWDLNVGVQEVGNGFNPAIGFLSRRGYRKGDVMLMTRFRPDDFLKLQEIRPHTTYRGFWGLDDFHETGFWHIDSHWQFRDSTEIHTGMNLTHEGVRTPFEIAAGREVTLEWTVPPGAVNGYRIEYRIGDGSWNELDRWLAATRRTTEVRLPAGTARAAFRMRAWNDGGTSAYSHVVTNGAAKRRSVR
jgi:hypothetical protein